MLASLSSMTLRRMVSGNPFDEHPQLREIWHADLQPHVETDTMKDLALGNADPARNLVYLIELDGTVVGITGVYNLGEDTLGLRWHGVVPSARHGGVSAQAFRALVKQARQERPERRCIVEYIEMGDPNAPRLLAHFQQLGFRCEGPVQDATRFPVECALPVDSGDWQAMVFDLAE